MNSLARGDVVMRGRRWGVVWRTDGGRVTLMPLQRYDPDTPTHRSDVRVSQWDALVELGMGTDIVVRAGCPLVANAAGQVVVYRMSACVIDALSAASHHEMETRALERRWGAWASNRSAMMT